MGAEKTAQCRFEWKLTSATMSATAVNAAFVYMADGGKHWPTLRKDDPPAQGLVGRIQAWEGC